MLILITPFLSSCISADYHWELVNSHVDTEYRYVEVSCPHKFNFFASWSVKKIEEEKKQTNRNTKTVFKFKPEVLLKKYY